MKIAVLAGACLATAALASCGADRGSRPEAPSAAPSPAAKIHTLKGTIRHRPWSKSLESWNAGGSDYYVLERSGAPGETVVLFGSATFAWDDLAKFVDKEVEIAAEYTEGTPPVRESELPPEERMSQHPVFESLEPDPATGRSVRYVQGRGQGYNVLTVKGVK